MNQDCTVNKKAIFVWKEKILAKGFTWKKKKKSCTSSERKKNSCKLKIPTPPPPPITFLMVRPLCKQAPKFTLFQMQWFFKPAWSKTHCYRAFPLDVTAAILVYQNNLIPRASPSKNGWLYPFFEGKALGTRLVPKQWSGSHVGVPNKSCGKLDYFY